MSERPSGGLAHTLAHWSGSPEQTLLAALADQGVFPTRRWPAAIVWFDEKLTRENFKSLANVDYLGVGQLQLAQPRRSWRGREIARDVVADVGDHTSGRRLIFQTAAHLDPSWEVPPGATLVLGPPSGKKWDFDEMCEVNGRIVRCARPIGTVSRGVLAHAVGEAMTLDRRMPLAQSEWRTLALLRSMEDDRPLEKSERLRLRALHVLDDPRVLTVSIADLQGHMIIITQPYVTEVDRVRYLIPSLHFYDHALGGHMTIHVPDENSSPYDLYGAKQAGISLGTPEQALDFKPDTLDARIVTQLTRTELPVGWVLDTEPDTQDMSLLS